jgi:hypothetical protein
VSDIVTFLRAQLDEDERVALTCPVHDWHVEKTYVPAHVARGWPTPAYEVGLLRPAFIDMYEPDGMTFEVAYCEHAARWDPTHVLAEVAAKRRILDLHHGSNDGDCTICVVPEWGYPSHGGSPPARYPCDTVRALLAPYADRPGYDPEREPVKASEINQVKGS